MSKQTFAERCQLAQQLLPDAQYRAMLTKLHAEMLEALAEQPKREWVGLTEDEFDDLRDNNFGISPLISAVEAKLKEKNHG